MEAAVQVGCEPEHYRKQHGQCHREMALDLKSEHTRQLVIDLLPENALTLNIPSQYAVTEKKSLDNCLGSDEVTISKG